MVDAGCSAVIEALNVLWNSGLILNDGHEIHERLTAGEDVVDIAGDIAERFGRRDIIQPVIESWPPLHREAISQMVKWALGKLDTEDRIMIKWKGDAEHPETVSRFELRDHTLLIEVAHPPGSLQRATVGS